MTRGRAMLVAALLLVVAIVVNIAQFRTSERDTDDNFDAIHRNGTADITTLVYNECAWCRDRYAIHLALRVMAPGSTVIVPASSPYRDNRYIADVLGQRLYSLGLVADIEWVSYRQAPDALAGLDIARYIVASGPGGEKGAPWAIATSDAPAPSGPPPDGYLAAALREGEHRDPDGRPRDFVLLTWPQPRVGSDRSYQDLLLETSLLPAPVREELAP